MVSSDHHTCVMHVCASTQTLPSLPPTHTHIIPVSSRFYWHRSLPLSKSVGPHSIILMD